MPKLILMRHGQSQWNLRNLFTGWVDIPLSSSGVTEALEGGKKFKDEPIDRIFTSTLIRAQMTAMLAMTVHHADKVPYIVHENDERMEKWSRIYDDKTTQQMIPVHCAWELNERMYGELQGLNKQESRERFGEEQIKIWRRSFDIPPPEGESLKMTAARTIPYFESKIVPYLNRGQNILVVAHGNSLRSIVMDLEKLTTDEVVHLELATGIPIIYDFSNGKFNKKV